MVVVDYYSVLATQVEIDEWGVQAPCELAKPYPGSLWWPVWVRASESISIENVW